MKHELARIQFLGDVFSAGTDAYAGNQIRLYVILASDWCHEECNT